MSILVSSCPLIPFSICSQSVHHLRTNHLTALYPGRPRWAGTKTLRNISPICHSHCPGRPRITWLSIVKQDPKQHHLTLPEAADLTQNRPLWRMMSMYGATQSLSCMPETPFSLSSNSSNSWKKHEEPKAKNPHFFYIHLLLDLMRSLVNHWSPLTHASHCMTTSRPAAATQMTVRVSPATQCKVFLCWMPFLP